MVYPTDDLEFQRQWSSKGGEAAALGRAVGVAEERASAAFVARKDDVAQALRDLARELKLAHDKARADLNGFIDEDRKRRYEKTKMLRH